MREGVHEQRLAPFEAEAIAMEMWESRRYAVLLLPARESVRWLVERHHTSIMASRRVLLTSKEWPRQLRELPAGAAVVYLGPPLTSAMMEPLAEVARTRPVHLILQAGDAYRQWLAEEPPNGGESSGRLILLQPDRPFGMAAIGTCRLFVRGARWSEVRICVPDDAGPELMAELHSCAGAYEVPLYCEELIGGAGSPVMGLLRRLAATDLAPDSVELAASWVSHELGVDTLSAIGSLSRELAHASTVPQRAELLVRAGRSVAASCSGRELYLGLTERLLERAERTAYRATSLPEWLDEVLRPRWMTTGRRDGVRVSRVSRGCLHAVQTTILLQETELMSPAAAGDAFAVCAGAVVRLAHAAGAEHACTTC